MRLPRIIGCVRILAAVLAVAPATATGAQTSVARSSRPDTVTAHDPIARLQARMSAGEVVLAHDSVFGYLPALLRELRIPVASQGLVFSRTSLQTDKIAPWSPRALYFNDDVYVGYVQESHFLEIAAVDPKAGAIFYTLSQEPRARPAFTRETTACLMCHQSKAATGGVPGLMVLSTIADRYGYPIVGVHEGTTTDITPIAHRWGGWYVTGTPGTSVHSGNVYSPRLGHEVYDKQQYRTQIDLTTESARTGLGDKFDATPYLTGHSDIVALMVLVHQTTVHNLITAAHETVREALRYEPVLSGRDRDTLADQFAPGTTMRVKNAVDRLVHAMLFAGEAPLDGPMRGTTSYASDFPRAGPRDRQGRSLRDFDLQRRLFRYPLSFLIYSESFDSLPELARREVYGRLRTILNGEDASPDFRHLQSADRKAILEILEATKPEFARLRPH